ncbi:MAG: ferritin-like domain-containing protein [Bacteroidota bacterium]
MGMSTAELGFKLKEFYLLELYQVKMFGDQLPALTDDHLRYAFTVMVERERIHLDYFAGKLQEIGAEKPVLAGDLFGFAGTVSAKALDLFTLEERYKFGIFAETKAIEMYTDFVRRAEAEDRSLAEMLWRYQIDEELHKGWFAAQLEALRKHAPQPAGT